MNELVEAIKKLRPTAEFSFQNDDYSTIKWDVLEGDAPTFDEVQATMQEIADAKKQAKDAAEAKLKALGLTANDLKALGLG